MSSQCAKLQPTNSWDRSVREFGAPQQISTYLASWFRYCSDVTYRRPTKLCTMFGCFLGWYIILIMCTFSGALAPWRNFALCKIHFTSKSCVLLYWQRYCTALRQRAWAKLRDMVQGMQLRNFRRGRHLYSAGRPSRWASAHILVKENISVVPVIVTVCSFTFLDLIVAVASLDF